MLAILAGLHGSNVAHAERIAVADMSASPEHQGLAGGLSLVLRTYVGSKANRVTHAELSEAASKVGAASLAVPPEKVADALAASSAEKWLSSELEVRAGSYTVVLIASDRSGTRRTRTVSAPRGDYDRLARDAASAAAQVVGVVALDRPKTGSFGGVASAGEAAIALAAGDLETAGRRFEAAVPGLGFEITAVREIAAPIVANTELDLDIRMNAALVAGDLEAAESLAKSNADDPRSQALLARVEIARVDHRSAKKLLAKVSRSKLPFVELARASLAEQLGQRKKLASSFSKLLGDAPYVPALALAATLRPGALGEKVEAAVLRAAVRVAKRFPALASQLATRALRGGEGSPPIFELIEPFEVSSAELKELADKLQALESGKLKSRVEGEIAVRMGQLAIAAKAAKIALNLDPDNPRAKRLATIVRELKSTKPVAAPSGEGDGAPAKPAELASPKRAAKIRQLADDLMPFLAAFPELGGVSKVVLAQREDAKEFPFWPTRVHPDRLRDGLRAALGDAPYGLETSVEATLVETKPSPARLAQIATDHGAGAVLSYSVRTKKFDAAIELVLYSRSTNSASELAEIIDDGGTHGLVTWNPIFVVAIAAIAGALLLWLVWLVLRGTGTIRLELKTDPASERPSFSVAITRRGRCPVVTDPKDHLARVTSEAKNSRFQANNIGAATEFERIPPGTWLVHIYGTFEKAGETRCLSETTEVVRVKRSRVSVASIDLVPTESEFHIIISGEGGPASGAVLWLSTEPAKRYAADVGGKGVIFAPPGEHTLHVAYRNTEVARKLTAFGSKVSTIHINLVRERRLAAVAEGLDFDFDPEAEPSAETGLASPASSLATGKTGFPPVSEDTPAPALAPVGSTLATVGTPLAPVGSPLAPVGSPQQAPPPRAAVGPSVESFRRAADGQTVGLPDDDVLTGLRRYRTGAVLGQGAMGIVYRAVDQVLDRAVALKVMSSAVKEHPSAAKMFEQEAKALAALNHPNVVTVYDQGRDGDEIYLVMEFVEGETLEDILTARQKLHLTDAASIGEQLGRSLSYAHSRRVIHRDVKPANVFVSPDGVVKLGDFGLARVLSEVQIKSTEIKGTPLYMAPEQIRGSDIDFRADIYALGCTMYEVLAGRPPFIEGEILYHHIHTAPDRLSQYVDVPSDVEALIMKCIAKDKSERVASADRIVDVFGAIRRGL